MSNNNSSNTLLSILNYILTQHPELALQFEKITQSIQGKGWGSATIEKEVETLQSFLKGTPNLAIDIGGNIGNYSAELRRINPELEIHIFEPSAINITKLTKRFNEDKKIIIQPFGVSETEGSATLFSNELGSALSSLSKRKLDHFNIDFTAYEAVNIIRFEDYWNNVLCKKHIDILKIDIEGHELSALQGMGEAIGNISLIQFEFGGCNIDTRSFFQDFWYFFLDAGFHIFRISPLQPILIERYSEENEIFMTTNYIAVNKRL
jgi:FkbM family methyltransferase